MPDPEPRDFVVSVSLLPEAIKRLLAEGVGGALASKIAGDMVKDLYAAVAKGERVRGLPEETRE